MSKKIFKAMLMGLRESKVLEPLKLVLLMVWLPLVAVLILKIFKIVINDSEFFALILILSITGFMISCHVTHCVDAVKYQDENHCDFSTAWRATDTSYDEY